jgi:hypothetical protein
VFSVFLSPRAVPATPEERLGASAEPPSRDVLPDNARLLEARPPQYLTGLHLSSLRATARGFVTDGLPAAGIQVPLLLDASQHHAGDRTTLLLSDS